LEVGSHASPSRTVDPAGYEHKQGNVKRIQPVPQDAFTQHVPKHDADDADSPRRVDPVEPAFSCFGHIAGSYLVIPQPPDSAGGDLNNP